MKKLTVSRQVATKIKQGQSLLEKEDFESVKSCRSCEKTLLSVSFFRMGLFLKIHFSLSDLCVFD